MKTEFSILSGISYYLDMERYNKVKYHVYLGELRMKLMRLFCKEGENFFGIHCDSKCLLAGAVRIFSTMLACVRHVLYVSAIHSEVST